MQLLGPIDQITKSSSAKERRAVGKSGEEIAAEYLVRIGYNIINRNVHQDRRDEIDIIAFDPDDHVYVFAEVKTRTKASADYRPEINITFGKRRSMARAARSWMAKRDEDVGYRMDVICVVAGKIVDHFIEIAWV